MTDDTDQKHDTDGLLRKNAELLAEVKSLKGKLAEMEGERDAALQTSSEAQDAMRRVAVERPLETFLGGAFVAPWRIVRPMLDEHFVIGIGGGDEAEIKTRTDDGEGEAVALNALFDHVQTIPDLAAMLRPPKGGGAGGSWGDRISKEAQEKPRQKVASSFGLR